MELLHVIVPSSPFFKTNKRIFRAYFSENNFKKLFLFFAEDGRAYGCKKMTGYLRQKHNVVIAEKRVDSTLSMVSPPFRVQRRT